MNDRPQAILCGVNSRLNEYHTRKRLSFAFRRDRKAVYRADIHAFALLKQLLECQLASLIERFSGFRFVGERHAVKCDLEFRLSRFGIDRQLSDYINIRLQSRYLTLDIRFFLQIFVNLKLISRIACGCIPAAVCL